MVKVTGYCWSSFLLVKEHSKTKWIFRNICTMEQIPYWQINFSFSSEILHHHDQNFKSSRSGARARSFESGNCGNAGVLNGILSPSNFDETRSVQMLPKSMFVFDWQRKFFLFGLLWIQFHLSTSVFLMPKTRWFFKSKTSLWETDTDCLPTKQVT